MRKFELFKNLNEAKDYLKNAFQITYKLSLT